MGNLLGSSSTRHPSGPASDWHQDLHSPFPQKKKKNQGDEELINATLPEELILQIVVRLPVKSVGRCRCVSTRWRSLFSDPQFAKSQFQVSPKHQSLIFQLNNRKLKTLGFDLSDTPSFEKEALGLQNLEAPFEHINLRFLGSCNGLVAACDFMEFTGKQEGLFIWNPSTRFFRQLPSRLFSSRRGERDDDDDDFIVGFGCVSSNDEYKLVIGAEIFSSKTSSWKPIEIPGGNFGNEMSVGVLCKGALHWVDYTDKHQGQLRLYAFDLEKEEFSMMKLPSALQSPIIMCDFGVTCEGCLFVLTLSLEVDCGCVKDSIDSRTGVLKFWVMREYGNSDSWTSSSVKILPQTPPWWNDCNWCHFRAVSVMETSAFVWAVNPEVGPEIMSAICRNEEQNTGIYMIQNYCDGMVVYEESLCCLA